MHLSVRTISGMDRSPQALTIRRKKLGLTRKELAEASGCSIVTLNKFLSGQRKLSPSITKVFDKLEEHEALRRLDVVLADASQDVRPHTKGLAKMHDLEGLAHDLLRKALDDELSEGELVELMSLRGTLVELSLLERMEHVN